MNYAKKIYLLFLIITTLMLEHKLTGENNLSENNVNQEESEDQRILVNLPAARWTIMNMIQADNDLAPFADLNLQSMKDGMQPTDKINIIVVWDKPTENKTNRLKITAGTATDDGSSGSELGLNPQKEILAQFNKTVARYPADQYGLILWDHGSGIEDALPGEFTPRTIKSRGILYDYTQATYLNNQALKDVCKKCSELIGKKLSFVGFDACFMAMLEVGYQIKDSAEYLVGSEETEPSLGWGYQTWLYNLTTNPFIDARANCQSLVAAYKAFYDPQNEPRYTQSTIDLSFCDQMKDNVNQLSELLLECGSIDKNWTQALLTTCQYEADGFDQVEYMDLFSFYDTLEKYCSAPTRACNFLINHNASESGPTRGFFMPKKRSRPAVYADGRQLRKNAQRYSALRAKKYQKLRAVMEKIIIVLREGKLIIEAMTPFNATGPEHQRSRGLSIYFPFAEQGVHPSYLLTDFYADTQWGAVIRLLHG